MLFKNFLRFRTFTTMNAIKSSQAFSHFNTEFKTNILDTGSLTVWLSSGLQYHVVWQNPEDRHLHNRCSEKLKFYLVLSPSSRSMPLMMRWWKLPFSKTLDFNSGLTWLIAQEDFIASNLSFTKRNATSNMWLFINLFSYRQ